MFTDQHPSTCTAYLLRGWLEGTTRRYSLQEVGTNKWIGFATLDEFISFMLARSIPAEQRVKPETDVNLLETNVRKSK